MRVLRRKSPQDKPIFMEEKKKLCLVEFEEIEWKRAVAQANLTDLIREGSEILELKIVAGRFERAVAEGLRPLLEE